jgi:hypothetical protein
MTRWADSVVKPCGTPAAYRRHKRHGERPCESCAQAERRRNQDRMRARRRHEPGRLRASRDL